VQLIQTSANIYNLTALFSDSTTDLSTYDLKDFVEAAQSFPDNLDGAMKYLRNRCMLCLETFARSKVDGE